MADRTRFGVVLALAALPLAPAEAAIGQDPQPFIAQVELFTNVTVIDGLGGAPRPESAILVWGGRIRAIGSRSQMSVPEGTTIVDLEGAWVVPGFIDAHAAPRTPEHFAALLANGITGVREAGLSRAIFDSIGGDPPGDGPAPSWFVGGAALEGALDSEEAAVAEVGRQISAGADFITLSPSIPSDWLAGVTRAARRADRPVWSDREGAGWLLALRAGVDVASRLVSGDPALLAEADREAYAEEASRLSDPAGAWLSRVDPEGPEAQRALGALLSRDASLIPLLAAAQAPLACVPGARGCTALAAEEADLLRAGWATAQALVLDAFQEGVRLLVGSDAPGAVEPGIGFHREMELLVEAGIPESEVLGMATRNGAIALGQLHERGTLEVGKRADFVVLEGDPHTDIGNARRIAFVMLEGRAWRPQMNGSLQAVRFR